MKAKMKITKDDFLKIERAARREAEIEFGLRINFKRVHKYTRAKRLIIAKRTKN